MRTTLRFELLGVGNNTQPPGGVNLPLLVNVGGSRGALGVKPRILVVRFTSPPPGYSLGTRLRIPILRQALWDAATPGISEGTYRGRPVIVVGKMPESIL